jgi:hypothetical protein
MTDNKHGHGGQADDTSGTGYGSMLVALTVINAF